MAANSTELRRLQSHPYPQALRVALFGECMLELQGTAFGPMTQAWGGDTFNTAVYLARCGAAQGLQVAYATALGTDPLSSGLMQRWAAEGLDMALVRRLPGRMPGLYQILVDDRGERSFLYWRERSAARDHFASAEPTPLEQAADGLHLLYFSGISLAILDGDGRDRLLALAARLRARGAQVVFDNNYRPALWPDAAAARHWYDRTYPLCSTALLTLDDEQALRGGLGADDTLALARRLPVGEVAVKRGAQPACVRVAGPGGADPQPWVEVPAQPVARVVDTTAAGDAFGAAYLAARLAGATPALAVAAGHRLAACVIQHPGAVIPLAALPPR